jgi:hypothetical protein
MPVMMEEWTNIMESEMKQKKLLHIPWIVRNILLYLVVPK